MTIEDDIRSDPDWPLVRGVIIDKISQGESKEAVSKWLVEHGVAPAALSQCITMALIDSQVALAAVNSGLVDMRKVILEHRDAGKSREEIVDLLILAGFDVATAANLVVTTLTESTPHSPYTSES